ncbi:MAG TPA: hypothetical protein QGF95_25725 [Candidatus Latescibacteria bacterium]|jgi:ketosteroid isomerase-like protein|nr:hypothetical protein [Candidatus Latescibacterota bacterium]
MILLSFLVILLLSPLDRAGAAETAETILIRQSLEKDRSGRRRGDAELVLSAYDEDRFVVWDAGGSIDGRAWSVLHGSRDEVADALETDLAVRHYDLKREVVLINVWKDKAFVTTVDSGMVIDSATGNRSPYAQNQLWTFRKRDEEWLATGVIVALGDSTSGPVVGKVEADDVAEALQDHAAEWSDGSASGISSGLTEEAVLVDLYFSANPAKWLIVFADREEIDDWLEERLAVVDYSIECSVEHAMAQGDEAVAVTQEQISATYAGGEARIAETQLRIWLLTRSGGTWQVDWVFRKAKPFSPIDGSTALH